MSNKRNYQYCLAGNNSSSLLAK